MENSIIIKDVPLRAVSDGDYLDHALRAIRHCKHRCLCNMFIIDYDLSNEDPRSSVFVYVDQLMIELAAAQWRGVDTRLLIGGSRTNPRIEDMGLLAQARARDLGIPVRLAAAVKDHNTHNKMLIADDQVITGSHNWAAGMLGEQTQDSVWLESAAVAGHLQQLFEELWHKTPEDGYDVSA